MSDGSEAPESGWTLDGDAGVASELGSVYRGAAADGRLESGFEAQARHLNKHGVVHGGFLLAFLDPAMGISTRRPDGRGRVTVQLNTQFVAAVEAGQFVVVECEVVREAGSLQFIRAVCRVGGRPVLMADGIWKAVSGRGRRPYPSP